MQINYQKDILIDPDNLDLECQRLPLIEERYVDAISELRKEYRYAEENVKVTRSELIREANSNPIGCCNKAKPTAPDIEAYYRTNTRHIDAKEEYIEAEDALNTAIAMKELIHFTKGKQLENMINLLGQNYWSGPDTPIQRNWEDIRTEKTKKVEKKIARGMKRKK